MASTYLGSKGYSIYKECLTIEEQGSLWVIKQAIPSQKRKCDMIKKGENEGRN